jgi:hypothetical protein
MKGPSVWCDICLRGEAAIQGFIQNPELRKTSIRRPAAK